MALCIPAEPGSLFTFGANVATGYEVPFSRSAYILVFKGDRLTASEKEFIDYLRGLAVRLEKEQSEGVPYHLTSLPDDHPALEFARRVHPGFDVEFGKSRSEASESVPPEGEQVDDPNDPGLDG